MVNNMCDQKKKALDFTPEGIAERHHVSVENVQIGQTPNGGAYTIIAEAGDYVSFTEYNENNEEVFRTSGFFR